ncbi:hypothetical protein [Aeromonas sobria]|uniref:hypothetical protein n=1 Tax=Aeromonas sobria TaxID=646 RepID=UPI0018E33F80|nr:hypothetical protein [Aeromonas sobria]
MLTNATIGVGVNTAVQLKGGTKFDYIDAMVAGFTAAATTGKGMLPSIGINAGGVALGSLAKGEDPTNSAIGATAGTVVGGLGGQLIKIGVSKIAKENTAESLEAIGGAYVSEKSGSGIKDVLDGAEKKMKKINLLVLIKLIILSNIFMIFLDIFGNALVLIMVYFKIGVFIFNWDDFYMAL